MNELGAWDGVLHAARDSNRMYEAAVGIEHMITDQRPCGATTVIFTHKHPEETVSYINNCEASLCARAVSIACERWGETMPHIIACVVADALDGFISGVSRTEALASLRRVRREHIQRVLLSRRDPTLDIVAWGALSLLEDCQDVRELLEALLSEKIKCEPAVWSLRNVGDTPVKYAVTVASGSDMSSGVTLTDLSSLCVVAIWSKTALRREVVSEAAARDLITPPDTARVGENTVREAVKKTRDGNANLVLEIGRRCAVEDLRWWLKEAPTSVIERWVDAATEKRTATNLAEALVWARESPALGEAAASRVRGLARDVEGGGYVLGYLFGRTMSRWCHSSTDWRMAADMSRTWDGTIEELGRCVNALGKH
jgi:hypothetical protein